MRFVLISKTFFMKNFQIISIFIAVVLAMVSCSDKQTLADLEPDTSGAYFSLSIGESITYAGDSIYYKKNQTPDTVSFLMKETVTDSLIDNEGELAFRIERSERKTTDEPWEIVHVFTMKKNQMQAQRNENNQRFISLVFPPSRNKSWDGIGFNADSLLITVRGEVIEIYKDWGSQYQEVDVPYMVNNLSFDSVLIVTHANSTNRIERRINREVYAKGIGLVEKEMSILDSQKMGDEERVWPDDAEKGFRLILKMIE